MLGGLLRDLHGQVLVGPELFVLTAYVVNVSVLMYFLVNLQHIRSPDYALLCLLVQFEIALYS